MYTYKWRETAFGLQLNVAVEVLISNDNTNYYLFDIIFLEMLILNKLVIFIGLWLFAMPLPTTRSTFTMPDSTTCKLWIILYGLLEH